MASISSIREAIGSTIQAVLTDLAVYSHEGGVTNLPAIVVKPANANFNGAMGRGTDEWDFHIYILVSRRDEEMAYRELDDYIAGAGANSIRQILFTTPNIGLSDTTVAVAGVRGYGGRFAQSGVHMVGALIDVKVYTSGTS